MTAAQRSRIVSSSFNPLRTAIVARLRLATAIPRRVGVRPQINHYHNRRHYSTHLNFAAFAVKPQIAVKLYILHTATNFSRATTVNYARLWSACVQTSTINDAAVIKYLMAEWSVANISAHTLSTVAASEQVKITLYPSEGVKNPQ